MPILSKLKDAELDEISDKEDAMESNSDINNMSDEDFASDDSENEDNNEENANDEMDDESRQEYEFSDREKEGFEKVEDIDEFVKEEKKKISQMTYEEKLDLVAYIYLITNMTNQKKYVGQTIQDPNQRWNAHTSRAYRGGNDCPALYGGIRYYGKLSFKFEVLIKTNAAEVDYHEIKMIKEHNSLVPNGYNIQLGGSFMKKFSEETKQKLREMALKRDIKPFKKSWQTYLLPKHVYHVHTENAQGYRIHLHPNCKNKSFTCRTKNMEEKKELAIKYLEWLDNGGVHIEKEKLPKGIRRLGEVGFSAHPKYNGEVWKAEFTSVKLGRDENLRRAEAYYKDVQAGNLPAERDLPEYLRHYKRISKKTCKIIKGYEVSIPGGKKDGSRLTKLFTNPNVPLEKRLRQALKFLEEEKHKMTLEKSEKPEELPAYVQKFGEGYRVNATIGNKHYRRQFTTGCEDPYFKNLSYTAILYYLINAYREQGMKDKADEILYVHILKTDVPKPVEFTRPKEKNREIIQITPWKFTVDGVEYYDDLIPPEEIVEDLD